MTQLHPLFLCHMGAEELRSSERRPVGALGAPGVQSLNDPEDPVAAAGRLEDAVDGQYRFERKAPGLRLREALGAALSTTLQYTRELFGESAERESTNEEKTAENLQRSFCEGVVEVSDLGRSGTSGQSMITVYVHIPRQQGSLIFQIHDTNLRPMDEHTQRFLNNKNADFPANELEKNLNIPPETLEEMRG